MPTFAAFLVFALLASFSDAAPHGKSTAHPFEEALCNTKHPNITPLNKPVINYGKAAKQGPEHYLKPYSEVFGKGAAQWHQEFFRAAAHSTPSVRTTPEIAPIREGAPTIISLYYPHPNPRSWKSQSAYFERIKRLADTGEQVMIYVAKEVSAEIKKMRDDKHWHVIDEYETIWDIPNNRFQKENFESTQPKIFQEMRKTGTEAWKPSNIYNDGFYSAAYNAKAFIVFDAPLRNPFGSDRWVYMDGGLLQAPEGPEGKAPMQNGQPWGMITGGHGFLDTTKIDRSIHLTQDTGVVFPEYAPRSGLEKVDINSRAFTEPLYQWQDKFYLGGLFVGNTLGMLNYAVRYMQTVDILDANGRYSGREEFVTPIVAAMYPNTVFSQPVQKLPPHLDGHIGDSSI